VCVCVCVYICKGSTTKPKIAICSFAFVAIVLKWGGSHYAAQAGLELLVSSDPPASVS
jgi:hypothetical protein